MQEREMLELAAKAAGIVVNQWREDDYGLVAWIEPEDKHWSPLDDDGDALRLAVALNFTVSVCSHEVEVFTEEGECTSTAFAYDEDKGGIVRRIIVRAAAEIGKQMEEK